MKVELIGFFQSALPFIARNTVFSNNLQYHCEQVVSCSDLLSLWRYFKKCLLNFANYFAGYLGDLYME